MSPAQARTTSGSAPLSGNDEVGVVERCSVGVGERVTEFASLVDGSRRFRRCVAWDAARQRELAEQPLHSRRVEGHIGVCLTASALQPRIGHDSGPTVTWSRHEKHVQISGANDAVQVGVNQSSGPGWCPSDRAIWA